MSNEQTENEMKKEYLQHYRKHVRRIRRIEEEIEELQAMKLSISAKNDGMPHGSGQRDLSGYAAKLDQLERNLIRERCQRIESHEEISGQIENLDDENESDVLFYRYIKGMRWWEIAEKMGYTERNICRIHGKALVHFEVPELYHDE
ncbi:MAG: hypothetical protein HFI18_11195 [Lachnospiraceae bacterium]|nr:hypothetical protein [Lachnospiraceae bacterium]